jgi:hypothetical protein
LVIGYIKTIKEKKLFLLQKYVPKEMKIAGLEMGFKSLYLILYI